MPSGRLCNIPRTTRGRRPPRPILTIPVTAQEPVRRAIRALVLIVAVLAVATPAGAAQSCGRTVIDDWYDDGRVDGTYALHCYDDAIEILPRDVRDYSSAKEDIQRALAAARRGEDAPPARTDPTPESPAASPGDPEDPGDTSTTETTSTPPTDGAPTDTVASPPVADTDSASSVPIPLLILAGLALLLVAGGSAGYLIRRLQARRAPPPAV